MARLADKPHLFGRIHGCLALFALYVSILPLAALLLGVPAFTIGLALVACRKALARAGR